MRKIKMGKSLKRALTPIKKHAPEILTGVGIIGAFGGTAMAVKATVKATRYVDEHPNDDKKDILKKVAPYYGGAAVTLLSSAACLIGSTHISVKRGASLAVAYELSEQTILEYKRKLKEAVKDEKKREAIEQNISQKLVDQNPIVDKEVIPCDGEDLFFDSYSGRYFKSSVTAIKAAAQKLNDESITERERGSFDIYPIRLNDFYNEIGLKETVAGDELGWNTETGLISPVFREVNVTTDGRTATVLDFTTEGSPITDYDPDDIFGVRSRHYRYRV